MCVKVPLLIFLKSSSTFFQMCTWRQSLKSMSVSIRDYLTMQILNIFKPFWVHTDRILLEICMVDIALWVHSDKGLSDSSLCMTSYCFSRVQVFFTEAHCFFTSLTSWPPLILSVRVTGLPMTFCL